MRQVAVIGYASIDYPAVLDGFFEPDRTTMIRRRPVGAFPRPGGCPLYTAAPMAAAGIDVSVVTWVGSDDHGRLFASQARRRGIGADGIGRGRAGRYPGLLCHSSGRRQLRLSVRSGDAWAGITDGPAKKAGLRPPICSASP